MAKVGAVSVTVTARTSAFQKKMRRAAKRMRVFGKAALRTARRVVKLGAGMAAVAVGGLALLTKQSLKNIDALAKVAQKLDISTEALAGMGFAAGLAGVKVESMRTGLQRMSRRLAQAAQGAGEAKDTIKALGLNAAELSRKSPDQAFLDIADAMRKIPGRGTQILNTFKLFDTEGVDLIRLLDLGRKGLEDIFEEAVRFGVAISSFDAKKIELANDAIFRSKQLFVGLGNQIAIVVSPAIKHLTEQFIDWSLKGESSSNVVKGAMTDVLWFVEQIDLAIKDVQMGFFAMGKFAEIGAQAARIGWSKTLAILGPAIGEWVQLFEAFTGKGTPQYEALSRSNNWIGAFDDKGVWMPDVEDLRKGATKTAIDWTDIFNQVAKEQEIGLDNIFKEFDDALFKMGIQHFQRETWPEWFKRISSEMENAANVATDLGSAMDAFDPSKTRASIDLLGRGKALQFPEGTAAGSAAAQRLFARADFAGSRNPAAKAVNGLRDDIRGYIQTIDERMEKLIADKPVTISRGS